MSINQFKPTDTVTAFLIRIVFFEGFDFICLKKRKKNWICKFPNLYDNSKGVYYKLYGLNFHSFDNPFLSLRYIHVHVHTCIDNHEHCFLIY